MTDRVDIREARPGDVLAIERLYPQAFPGEDLLPLVRDLLSSSAVSFVAFVGDALVGHAAFTPCSVDGSTDKVALLGPLAVAPDLQRKGIGSAVVRAGLAHMATSGTAQVYVLGDPAYYRRFGFQPDDSVAPPFPLPEEWRGAWQSYRLSGDKPPLSGKLEVPQAWRRRILWAP